MASLNISEDTALVSRGTLVDANNVNTVYINRQNGPNWSDTVPSGSYQFSCFVAANVGTKVTVSVKDNGAQIASNSATITGTPGAFASTIIDVNFNV